MLVNLSVLLYFNTNFFQMLYLERCNWSDGSVLLYSPQIALYFRMDIGTLERRLKVVRLVVVIQEGRETLHVTT